MSTILDQSASVNVWFKTFWFMKKKSGFGAVFCKEEWFIPVFVNRILHVGSRGAYSNPNRS